MATALLPVILCGGTGTRLWPLSRADMAKQFLPLAGEKTLLQETVGRVARQAGFLPPLVIGAHAARFIIRDQLAATAHDATILLEPGPRNTLASVLLAATHAARTDPAQVLAVLPADHLIGDAAAYRGALARAAKAATAGGVALIGIVPGAANPAYGYIVPVAGPAAAPRRVARFVEKPAPALAADLIDRGALWNAGIFCFRADWLIAAARQLRPDDVDAIERSLAGMTKDLGMFIPDKNFNGVAQMSFDQGILEQTSEATVVDAGFSWSDLGDWNALWAASEHDGMGNATQGNVLARDAQGNLIHAEGRTVCAFGVKDLAIIETSDAVLVAPRARAQDVKGLVDDMAARGLPIATQHARTHRPWGWYQTTDQGERFRVKRIVVHPGASLSLQRHRHRAEHWVVVRGTAQVTLEGRTWDIHENESAFIPIGAIHRLANPGKIPAEIIEVQTGTYLEEDDIERFDDPTAQG